MRRKFKVTVNGAAYEVEVEEIGEGLDAGPAVRPAAVTHVAPQAVSRPAVAMATAGGKAIVAPMPGTILRLAVETGAAVKRGQVLLVLEAMKMENEIKAGADGTVASIHVKPGDAVNTGQPLMEIG